MEQKKDVLLSLLVPTSFRPQAVLINAMNGRSEPCQGCHFRRPERRKVKTRTSAAGTKSEIRKLTIDGSTLCKEVFEEGGRKGSTTLNKAESSISIKFVSTSYYAKVTSRTFSVNNDCFAVNARSGSTFHRREGFC